jgi:ATP-dependent Clp protease adaptor protein ClpS
MAGEDNQHPTSQSDESSGCDPGATAAVAEPKQKQKPSEREPGMLPPYKVLLHNDDVNTFEHVIVTIVRLTSLGPEEAIQRTLEAHEAGLALLVVTHKERAELYQEQFASASLTVTIEPD